jgi:hypothetical protein
MIMRMIFRRERPDPKLILRIGMLFLAISIVWPRLVPLTGSLGTDAVDGLKGLLLGIALGLMIWAARLGAFRRPDQLR